MEQHTSIIYYRTPTLESRIQLADELMETVIPPPENGKHRHVDWGTWETLLKDIRDEIPLRNQLAHSPVGAAIYGIVDDETGKLTQIKEIRMQSYPHNQEMLRQKNKNKKTLQMEDLENHMAAVRKLHERLEGFRKNLLPAHIAKLFPQNIAR